ncbi:Trk system potassium uptake protein [uncultured Alphaproteobacteria bacterium]|uniref:Trk system potassium uptake protein n=1 Tax=uncultured Alphaproteobacteria bacterium TaxID=91750 RepID=A0A212JTL9_9PROT|nr:Trk system potassium uptake protein [uncultured Alphaproteobacteria bacterium]
MLDIRPVLYVVGLLLLVLAAAMALPVALSFADGGGDGVVFAAAAAVTVFFALALILSCEGPRRRLNLRHVFLLTAVTWGVLPLFAALPFSFGSARLDYTDAVFEAMSGLTTTGSSVIADLLGQSRATLLWRSLLQWLGGIGIVLMAVTLLPMLRVGGMQVFKTEAFDTPDKVFARVSPVALQLALIYAVLTAVWIGLYWAAGMNGFDAVNHAMTTLATGGFSTRPESLSYWPGPAVPAVATLGMIAAALPFTLYLQLARGGRRHIDVDSQIAAFLAIVAIATAVIAAWLVVGNGYDLEAAAGGAAFHVVSIITGTGFLITDVQLWGPLPVALLFVLQYVGGCAGSTTCGFKVFRFQVLYAAAKVQVARMLRPHIVLLPRYNGRPLQAGVTDSVMAFFFLYALSVAWLTVGLSLLGLDFTTALSGASTAISNVGPGFGDIIGPQGGFATLPDAAKWMLTVGMLLGRLEILSVLVLFQRAFWQE